MKKKDRLFPYFLLAPSMAIILFVLIIPLGYSVYCSLYKCDYMKFTDFVGLENYIKVFTSPSYLQSLGKTFLFSFTSLAISLFFGLVFALWIHKYKGVYAYAIELLVLIPWVTSQVVGTLLWKWILNEDLGLFNYVLSVFGATPLKLLSSPTLAQWTLIFVMSWRTIGYAMVNILAGLKSIPSSIEDAARIDGANSFQLLRYVRLPMVKTQILISTIILTLSNINNLTVPLSLTGGGPGKATSVFMIPIYRLGFESYKFGLSSAMSVLLMIVTIALSVIYVRAAKYEI